MYIYVCICIYVHIHIYWLSKYLHLLNIPMDNYFGILSHSYIKHWPLLFLQQAYGGHSVGLEDLLAIQHRLFCIALFLIIVDDSLFASHLHDIKCA